MEIQQLRCFEMVSYHGSFSRAAEAMSLSQSALSQAVARLETEFGAALFHRAARGATLTSVGAELLPVARQVLRAVDRTSDAVSAIHGLESGRLSVVTFAAFINPAAEAFAKFRSAYPGIRLDVYASTHTDAIVELLESGVCEVGFGLFESSYRHLEIHPIAIETTVALVPRSFDDGRSDLPIDLATLARLPFVASPPGTRARNLLDELLASEGLEADVVVTSDHHPMGVELARCGTGVYVTTLGGLPDGIGKGVAVRVLEPERRWPIGLAHLRGDLSPAAGAFRTLMLELFNGSAGEATKLFASVVGPTP